MRRRFRFAYESARVYLMFDDDAETSAQVVDMMSLQRGLGHATEALKKAVSYADEKGISLRLKVQRSGNPRNTLSNEQLVAFYEKFGFEATDPPRIGVKRMVRKPLLKGDEE